MLQLAKLSAHEKKQMKTKNVFTLKHHLKLGCTVSLVSSKVYTDAKSVEKYSVIAPVAFSNYSSTPYPFIDLIRTFDCLSTP